MSGMWDEAIGHCRESECGKCYRGAALEQPNQHTAAVPRPHPTSLSKTQCPIIGGHGLWRGSVAAGLRS